MAECWESWAAANSGGRFLDLVVEGECVLAAGISIAGAVDGSLSLTSWPL
jgi:hypothetical protein